MFVFECGKGWIFSLQTQAQVSAWQAVELALGMNDVPETAAEMAPGRLPMPMPCRVAVTAVAVIMVAVGFWAMIEYSARYSTLAAVFSGAVMILGAFIFHMIWVDLGPSNKSRHRWRWRRGGEDDEEDAFKDGDGSDFNGGGDFD